MARDDDKKFKTMSEKRDRELWKIKPTQGEERGQERKEEGYKAGNRVRCLKKKGTRDRWKENRSIRQERERSPNISSQHRVLKG